jgi:hypothetical protein
MLGVTTSRNPDGTAEHVFRGLRYPVYGKTGTAQTGVEPHAWFAAYTDAGDPNLADIAVAVIVENGGEGSDWSAPIARRIIEQYLCAPASCTCGKRPTACGPPEPPEKKSRALSIYPIAEAATHPQIVFYFRTGSTKPSAQARRLSPCIKWRIDATIQRFSVIIVAGGIVTDRRLPAHRPAFPCGCSAPHPAGVCHRHCSFRWTLTLPVTL